MEQKRVWIGLPAGEALGNAVAGFRHAHSELDVRWIPQENLHVTMVPPWELTDPEPVCRMLEKIASDTAMMWLRFESVALGPDLHDPRLLWARGVASERQLTLAAELNGRFGAGVIAQRGFLLHLTIARLRRRKELSGNIITLNEPVDWAGPFDTLCLYESLLKAGGAECRVLGRFALSS